MAAHTLTPKRRRGSDRGFTMIEVMIAVLLTAIATSGIIGLYMVQSRSSGFARHQTEATILAQDALEKLRTVPDTANGGDASLIDAMGQTGTGGIYDRSWTIAQGTPATFYELIVTVEWDEDGQTKQVVLHGRRNI